MEAGDMVSLTLEGALSLMLVVFSYKIYKMKIKSHSGCCLEKGGLNGITIDTQNSGVSSEDDVLNKI
jgi:hypothetical protein